MPYQPLTLIGLMTVVEEVEFIKYFVQDRNMPTALWHHPHCGSITSPGCHANTNCHCTNFSHTRTQKLPKLERTWSKRIFFSCCLKAVNLVLYTYFIRTFAIICVNRQRFESMNPLSISSEKNIENDNHEKYPTSI